MSESKLDKDWKFEIKECRGMYFRDLNDNQDGFDKIPYSFMCIDAIHKHGEKDRYFFVCAVNKEKQVIYVEPKPFKIIPKIDDDGTASLGKR